MQSCKTICIAILSLFIACNMSNEKTTIDTQTTAELNKLNELLRDSTFAVKVANYHEAGYADASGVKQSLFAAAAGHHLGR